MLLFVNSVNPQCGVYQYGRRLFEQIKAPNMVYVEVASQQELSQHLKGATYTVCVLNYHPSLFPWWTPLSIKTFYIFHESQFPFDPNAILNTDPTHALGIPRPIPQVFDIVQSAPDIPTFGSFGFGFHNKGFERIIDVVQSQYSHAILRFVIPYAHYGDADGSQARDIVARCRQRITNENIRLQVTHTFLSDPDIISFLASNTMNIFLYDHMPGRGCSSVIDFALASRKPIAISDSAMFRHIYSDAICAYKRPLRDILADGDRHILPFIERWNPHTLRTTVLDRVGDFL